MKFYRVYNPYTGGTFGYFTTIELANEEAGKYDANIESCSFTA